MIDPVMVVAVALLVLGVLATLVPLVPGSLLSLTGVYLYWVASGFATPGPVALAVLTILGAITLFAELFGNAVAARIGGARWRTTGAAIVVGIVLLFVTGPIGLLVGLFGTVLVLELYAHGDVERGARTAAVTVVGVITSTVMQVALTGSMLLLFLLVLALQ